MKVINQLLEHLKYHLTRTELENLVQGGFLEPAQVADMLTQREDTELEFELTLSTEELDLLPAGETELELNLDPDPDYLDSEFELTLLPDPQCPEGEFELSLEPEEEEETVLLLYDDEVIELPASDARSDLQL